MSDGNLCGTYAKKKDGFSMHVSPSFPLWHLGREALENLKEAGASLAEVTNACVACNAFQVLDSFEDETDLALPYREVASETATSPEAVAMVASHSRQHFEVLNVALSRKAEAISPCSLGGVVEGPSDPLCSLSSSGERTFASKCQLYPWLSSADSPILSRAQRRHRESDGYGKKSRPSAGMAVCEDRRLDAVWKLKRAEELCEEAAVVVGESLGGSAKNMSLKDATQLRLLALFETHLNDCSKALGASRHGEASVVFLLEQLVLVLLFYLRQ